MASPVPYSTATSGAAARAEITKLLRRMGCESVGFIDNFEQKTILLAFWHRGREIQVEASARGWAACSCARTRGRRGCGGRASNTKPPRLSKA